MATNKEKFNRKYGFEKGSGHSIAEISRKTGVSTSILNEVKNRGRGARKSNPQSVRRASDGKKVGGKSLAGKMSADQWGQARVYSFVMGGKTQSTADKDLWAKHKGKRTQPKKVENKNKKNISNKVNGAKDKTKEKGKGYKK